MSYDELPVRGRNRTSDYFTQVFALEWQVFSKHAVPEPPVERQDCSEVTVRVLRAVLTLSASSCPSRATGER